MSDIIVGVTSVIRDSLGRVLLGLKGRSFSPEYVGKWVTPGGKVNHLEPLHLAAIRETQEETGLLVSVIKALAPKELIRPPRHYVFFVFECDLIGGEQKAGDDLTELKWVDPKCVLRDEVTQLTWDVLLTL